MLNFVKRALICFLASLTVTLNSAWTAEKLVLSTGLAAPLVDRQDSKGFVESVARELFGRLGYQLEVVQLPSKLALIQSNLGEQDGQILRVAGLEQRYENLRRIPEPMMHTEFVAFSRRQLPTLDSWELLRQFDISYVNGWQIFERNIPAQAQVRKVDKPRELFELLAKDKTQLVLYEKWQGVQLIRDMGLNDVVLSSIPTKKVPQYIYLHKRHEALIVPAAEELKRLKEEGVYQTLYQSILGAIDEGS